MYTQQIIVLTFILLIILHIRLPKGRLVNIYLLCTWLLFLVGSYISFTQKSVNIGLLVVLFIYTILTFYYVKIKNKANNRMSIIIIILLWFIYSSFFIKNKKITMNPVPTNERVMNPVPTNDSVMNPVPTNERVMNPVPTNERVINPVDIQINENQSFVNRVRRRLNKYTNSTLTDIEYDELLNILSTEEDEYIKKAVMNIFKANNLNKLNISLK